MPSSLKIDDIRKELKEVQGLVPPVFVAIAAQVAPFTLIGLVAAGHNYLPAPIPVQPGRKFIAVPLNPAPPAGSELWWAVLAGTNIPGLAAVLDDGTKKRLLGRKNSVGRAEVWSGSSVV